jgi:hypothetical protein
MFLSLVGVCLEITEIIGAEQGEALIGAEQRGTVGKCEVQQLCMHKLRHAKFMVRLPDAALRRRSLYFFHAWARILCD